MLTIIPLAVVLGSWLSPQPEVWQHLRAYVLPQVLRNTVIISVGVACMVGVLGISLAWLTAVCDFPLRRFFSWALILPLALPASVLAAVEVGLFDYSGALQTFLREVFGNQLSVCIFVGATSISYARTAQHRSGAISGLKSHQCIFSYCIADVAAVVDGRHLTGVNGNTG